MIYNIILYTMYVACFLLQYRKLVFIMQTLQLYFSFDVFMNFQGYVRNGWDQVSVVYMTAGRLITELRYQNEDIGPRERQMEGYTGTFLSDSGLQEWTAEHGGLVRKHPIRCFRVYIKCSS